MVVDSVREALERAPTVAVSEEEAASLESVDKKGPWSEHEDVVAKIRPPRE